MNILGSTKKKDDDKGKHHGHKKYEIKSEAITPVKSSQKLKGLSNPNITIPSSVLKTLGLGLNSRNQKSSFITGESGKSKGK